MTDQKPDRQDDGDGLRTAAEPFAKLGGPTAANEPSAYHDLPDDTVIYHNSGACITAGDVRNLRRALASPPTRDGAEGSKISLLDARAIRYLWKARWPGVNRQTDIAKIYGVSQRTVSLIVRGESWKEGAGK